jgi:hypothetical protein
VVVTHKVHPMSLSLLFFCGDTNYEEPRRDFFFLNLATGLSNVR